MLRSLLGRAGRNAPHTLGALLVLFGTIASCDKAVRPDQPGDYTVTPVSGDGQSAEVAARIQPTVVQVSVRGALRENVAISWTAEGGCVPDSARSLSKASGLASMGWTMGQRPGACVIKAFIPGATQDARFTATVTVGPVARLKISPTAPTLNDVGDSLVLSVTGADRFDNPVSPLTVQWRSLDEVVAWISSSGYAYGRNGGTARIVAAAGNAADTVRLLVNQQPARISITTRGAVLHAIGATTVLSAEVRDRLGNIRPSTIEWSSLSTDVATVDASGRVTAVRNGTARIRAAVGSVTDTASVSVTQVAARVAVQPAAPTVAAGDSVLLQASVLDSLGVVMPDALVTWRSADPNLALLHGAWVCGRHTGVVGVYATSGAVEGASQVTIRPGPLFSVSVSPALPRVLLGGVLNLTASFADAFGNAISGITPTWTTLDGSRLAVDAQGGVTGLRVGSGNLRVDGGGRSALVTVVVTAPYSQIVRMSAPLAYWRLEEVGGTTAVDSSGARHDGQFVNSPVLGASLLPALGRAAAVSLSADGVLVASTSPWSDLATFSLELWIRPAQVTYPEDAIILDKGGNWNVIITPSGYPALQFTWGGGRAQGPAPLVAGQTYHLVGTYQPGSPTGVMKLYVNGVLVATNSLVSGASGNTPAVIHIGQGLTSPRWEYAGSVDEVAIYGRALSVTEIEDHFTAGMQ